MENTIEIKYWWECSKFPKGIPEELKDELHEHAIERAMEMIKEDFISGELFTYVFADIDGHKTPEDGWECSGGFTVSGLIR